MLAAHVDPAFNQLQYDQGSDFSVSPDANGINVIKPLTDDAQSAFVILQHAVNRILAALQLPMIPESGVLDAVTFRGIFLIANSDQPITQAQAFLDSLRGGTAYRDYVQLGPFRTQQPPPLTNFMNSTLVDLGTRARMWGSLFQALADTIWWSTSTGLAPPAPTASTIAVVPIVVAGLLGVALGIVSATFVFRRRMQSTRRE